jgi:hypothetical protein
MNGNLNAEGDDAIAVAIAEAWAGQNLYCPDCASPKLDCEDSGGLACPKCAAKFQLKARTGDSVEEWMDGAMVRAIQRGAAPSFFFMEYDAVSWTVRNLLLVPHFAIPPQATDFSSVPADARISIVTTIKPSAKGNTECVILSTPQEVRGKFERFKPFEKLKPAQRGLALELLKHLHALTEERRQAKQPLTFTAEEIFTAGRAMKMEGSAAQLRQAEAQLSVLANAGFVAPPQRGRWRLK